MQSRLKNRKGMVLLDGIVAMAVLALLFTICIPNLLQSQKNVVSNEQDTKAIFVAEQKRADIETLKYDEIKSEAKVPVGNGFSTEVVVSVGTNDEKNITINVYDSTTNNLLITIPIVIFNDRKEICNPTYGQKYVDGIWTTLTTSATYSGTPCNTVDKDANDTGKGSYWYAFESPPTGGHWLKLDYGVNSKQIFNQVQLQGVAVSDSYITNSFKDIVIYGSNDDKTYVNLGSGTGQNNYLMQFFNINNNTAYRFYRVNIPTSYGRSSSSATICNIGKCVGFQEVRFNKVSGIKNFGTYRAWDDGTYAQSAWDYIKGDLNHSYSGDVGDGIYRIQLADGTVGDVYADMVTDGGGWTLVARGNYNTPIRHNGVVTPSDLGYVNINAKNISFSKIKELLVTPTQNTTVYYSFTTATTLETGVGPKNADGYSGINFPMSVRLSDKTFTQRIATSCSINYTNLTVTPWEGASFLWNSYGWCQYGNGAFYTVGIATDTIPGGQRNMQTYWSAHDSYYQHVSLGELWIR